MRRTFGAIRASFPDVSVISSGLDSFEADKRNSKMSLSLVYYDVIMLTIFLVRVQEKTSRISRRVRSQKPPPRVSRPFRPLEFLEMAIANIDTTKERIGN